MNLEATGRHALLFDDDAMAKFVNSADALVDWNSLAIDRYDVRHLLSSPPPPRKRRSPVSAEVDLDYERWLDLPSEEEQQEQQLGLDISVPSENAGGFHNVGYAYDYSGGESTDLKGINIEFDKSCFAPPFPVPENLIHNLPPTEKVHQIIARTAKFVSEHGGQSEIVLRVKQGDNPTFGFLMPSHHLHAYFKFLINHQELLNAIDNDQEVKNSTLEQNESDAAKNGALSLLSSLYGAREDDDGTQESTIMHEQNAPGVTDVLQEVPREAVQTDNVLVVPTEENSLKDFPLKEKVLSKRSSNLRVSMVGTSKSVKKSSETKTTNKQIASGTIEIQPTPDMLEMPRPEAIILEPPNDVKKLIDKIVEFVQRNGKEVENVLREQDVKHGRFPFLVSTNLYHPYYLKMLQMTHESSATEKCVTRHGKKTAGSKESESLSTESTEFPFDADRREKFTMVLSKSKVSVQTSKSPEPPTNVGMDTTSIAAILQAATRGAKLPSSMVLSKSSVNGSGQNVDGQASSTDISRPEDSFRKQNLDRPRKLLVPSTKNIVKIAALAAASEADSSEASMTREQKLKAERLKRAKMFAAIIKGGGTSIQNELIRGNSEERPESGVSGFLRDFSVDQPESGASLFVGEVGVNAAKEREGSSILPDVETLKETDKFEMKVYDDEDKERRSKRSYRSNIKKDNSTDDEASVSRKSTHKHRSRASDEISDNEVEGNSRKSRRFHSHNDEDIDVNEKGVKEHSRKKHRSHIDDYENGAKVHSRRKHKSHRSSRDSKERHGHGKEHSSKHHSHRDRHRHLSSDDDEHHHHRSRKKSRKESQSHEDASLEEGEYSADITKQSKPSAYSSKVMTEASSGQNASCPEETKAATATVADIPDELRAKVRAMLLANL